MLDGEWNAGPGVHDANATTWKDLIGTLDLSVSSSEFSKKSLSRQNSAKGYFAYKSGILWTGTVYYVEFCCDLKWSGWGVQLGIPYYENGSTVRVLALKDCTVKGYGVSCGVSGATSVYARPWPSGNMKGTIGLDITGAGYHNGSAMTTAALSAPAGNAIGGTIAVGNNASYNNYGDIYRLAIYNRALTEEEIVHNYIVDKVRFGL